jgi:hypothetical protein
MKLPIVQLLQSYITLSLLGENILPRTLFQTLNYIMQKSDPLHLVFGVCSKINEAENDGVVWITSIS